VNDGRSAAYARRSSRLRGGLVWVLVVLCSIAVVVTAVTWWAHYTVMSGSGYMKIVGPVGKDQQAIDDLSQYISDQIATVEPSVDKQQVTAGAETILGSEEAYQVWLAVNRVGHDELVALLRDKSSSTYTAGGDIKLNLLPLISQVLVWADENLPGGLGASSSPPVISADATADRGIRQVADWSGEQLPADFGQIMLVKASALGSARTAVAWFDRLMWILPLIVAALMALTILVSSRRARTAIALAIGAAVAVVIARVLTIFGSSYLTGQVEGGTGQHILEQVIGAALWPFTMIMIGVCVAAVIVAVAVWLLGRRAAPAGGRLAA
jgi:hypothetical protein